MALSSILRKLHIIKPLPKKEPVNINRDSKAIIEFIINLKHDQARLLRLFKEFLELRLEYRALQDPEAKKKNFRHQVNIFDEIIQAYSFFQEDVDINGQRVKEIAKAIRKMAKKVGEKDLIDRTNQLRWRFDW